ncbi:MAG TPA: M23 family metallopeptidase [Cytophagales bacterium]|nr:M23 family metallopeptidase [Cytophagales bacterium]
MWYVNKSTILLFTLSILFASCSKKVGKLFEPKSPYEKYVQQLKQADIEKTAIGEEWINAGKRALQDTVSVETPFKEVGYFSEEKVRALGFRFPARRGEVILINAEWESRNPGRIFIDLFEENYEDEKSRSISSADSTLKLSYEVEEDQNFIVRIQPELLRGGKYTITISKNPSLPYPIPGRDSKTVGSFFGMDRDGGRRKHEGIDIFVPKRTPVVAISEGRISSVKENRLGGKVVLLNDLKRNYTLYYAHLDSQMVSRGERVEIGDTLGLVGNTGNAITTPPHLHFGIYTWGRGAIDPFPFVANQSADYPEIKGNAAFINILVKAKDKDTPLYASVAGNSSVSGLINFKKLLVKNTLLDIIGLSGAFYKVMLPDNEHGYVNIHQVKTIEKPFETIVARNQVSVLDYPDSTAIIKDSIQVGKHIEIYGQFNNYLWVKYQNKQGWINQGF